MTSDNDWWGFSRTHGWMVLDRNDARNKSRYKLCFVRCSDWTEMIVDWADWKVPKYVFAPNYIAELPENSQASAETFLDELREAWKEKRIALALEKANQAEEREIPVRRAFWKKEIQQDIDDGNFIRAKERYSRNCADWWLIDFNEMLTQIMEANERRLAIIEAEQERTRQEKRMRDLQAEQEREVLALAKIKATAHIVERQEFDAFWRLKIAALALSYLTNEPVETSRESTGSNCWILHRNIDYLVGLYALRFDLAPPPEVPHWWAAASKHFSVRTYDWNDFHIELLSEEAEKLHYQRWSGKAPIFMEKTPAEHRENANAKEAGQEQLYYEQLMAEPNFLEDVRNQEIADSYKEDSSSSDGFYDGFAEDKHQFEHDFWR